MQVWVLSLRQDRSMATRRNVIVGLGTVAVGSGVLLGTGAVGASAQSGADMRVIAAGELTLSRGEGWDDSASDMSDSSIYDGDFEGSPADLPVAFVDDGENDDLTIEVAKGNEASAHEWTGLIEVANTGTSDVDIRIDYTEYSDDIATSYEGTDGGTDLDRYDAQSIFQFEDADANRLSPTPGNDGDEGANAVTVGVGETEQITVVTDLTGDQISAVADETTVSDPWQPGGDTDGVQFLEEIAVTNVE